MQTKDPPKSGRSNGYSSEIAETICDRLAEGQSLRAICADPTMPAKATVFRWLARHQEFRHWYALAREFQADMLADEILEIIDDSSSFFKKKTEADGKVTWVLDREHFARCRVKIAAYKMVLARLAPKKYGKH